MAVDTQGVQSNTTVGPNSVGGVTPPPIVALPKTPTTPTAPTGVASSQLATDTVNAQATGAQNLQNAVTDQATKVANAPTFNPSVSVVDLLSSKGMPSDFASRAKMAQSAGITDYVGSTQQNQQLMGYINNPPQTSGGSTTGSTTGSNTNTTSTTTSGSTGQNTPTNGTPGDIYTPALTQVQSDLASSLEDYNNKVGQILNGTFPLTQYQQAILTSTQSQFNELTQMQMLANKSYEGGVALAGNREGLNIQNPTEYLAEQNKAVSDGLIKIGDLDAEATKTMATLQQGFLDKDYSIINDQYTKLQTTLEDKAKAITDLQTRTDDLYKFTQDYQQKADEFKASQEQQRDEFATTQSLERAKFVAQYGGLIDPNTGQLKAGTDATTLPGVTALPTSLGGHFVDLNEVPTDQKAIVQQVAKANGWGVVDSSQNKTFNQSLTALSGLQTELANGGLNPNDKIVSDIQNKPSTSSVIFRIFGVTSPDNIATVLGAGGGSVPDVQDMTWQQASDYLKNNVYTTMGTTPEAQSGSAFLNANKISPTGNGPVSNDAMSAAMNAWALPGGTTK